MEASPRVTVQVSKIIRGAAKRLGRTPAKIDIHPSLWADFRAEVDEFYSYQGIQSPVDSVAYEKGVPNIIWDNVMIVPYSSTDGRNAE